MNAADRTPDQLSTLLDGRPPSFGIDRRLTPRQFQQRIAILDRVFLGIAIYSGLLGVIACWKWGLSVAIMRYLGDAMIVGALTLLGVVPACLFAILASRFRRYAAATLICSVYIVGFGLWSYSLVTAWTMSGKLPTYVGVAAGGIGVIPVAVFGALLHEEWLIGFGIATTTLILIVLRRFARTRIA